MDAVETPRPRRGRPPSLSHEKIVEAVLLLVRERRLEDISMREIAGALGVPVMTLYNYVSSKEDLNTLIVDHIFRPVRVPGVEEGTWDERLRKLERDARQAMARSPGVSVRAGIRSAEAMRLADGVMSILTTSGFDQESATRAFSVIYTFMLGQIEIDAFLDSNRGRAEPTYQDITGRFDATQDDLFEFGFDVVLTGLTKLLRTSEPGRTASTSRRR